MLEQYPETCQGEVRIKEIKNKQESITDFASIDIRTKYFIKPQNTSKNRVKAREKRAFDYHCTWRDIDGGRLKGLTQNWTRFS